MSQTLPLFPLGTVLYPGLALPLHIFEPRYRRLVRDLADQPEPRQFGVIAIREGRETGVDGVRALHEVGCVAALREVQEYPDGRFAIAAVGTERFRLVSLGEPRPYPAGEVDLLPEDTGDEDAARRLADAVRQAFRSYLDVLAERGGTQLSVPSLPDEPVVLSYLVAASMIVDLPDHQALLAAPDAERRLAAEHALLTRQTAVLRTLSSRPDPGQRYSPYYPN